MQMQWIELQPFDGSDGMYTEWYNFAFVRNLRQIEGRTRLTYADGSWDDVTETPEQILRKLQSAMTRSDISGANSWEP